MRSAVPNNDTPLALRLSCVTKGNCTGVSYQANKITISPNVYPAHRKISTRYLFIVSSCLHKRFKYLCTTLFYVSVLKQKQLLCKCSVVSLRDAYIITDTLVRKLVGYGTMHNN